MTGGNAVVNDPHVWVGRAKRGHEQWAGTEGWADRAACKDDGRFIDRRISEAEVQLLIDTCNNKCPVKERCLQWANAQTQPVGFVVAGGLRWKAWNHCAICGKKVRGVDRCPAHATAGPPAGTIEADGTGREYRITDEH